MNEVKKGWTKTRSILAAVAISSAVAGMASPVMAGAQSEADLRAMIDELRQTVEALEQKMAVMEENQTVADKTIQEVASQKSNSGLLLPENTTMKLYGYAKLDAMWTDSDGGGKFAYTPSAVHLDKEKDAHPDNNFLMHARQTRLGFATSTETPYGKFNTKIEGDFYGSGGNETYSNSWGFRLRRAYGELGNLLIGQEWSTFIDLAAYPETIDFGGAAGSLFIRQAMIRWSQPFDGGSVQFAIENPEADFESMAVNESGVLANTSIDSSNETLPDFVARVNIDPGFGHYSAVGMVRQLSYDNGVHDDDQLGYALSLNAILPVYGKDNVHFEANYGNALGRYLEAGFQDAFVDPVTGEIETNDQWGGFVSYQHFWTDNIRSTLVYSLAERDNDLHYVTNTAEKRYQSVHANLLWSPVPRVNIGVEYIWGYRELENGDDGDMNRVQAGFQFNF